LIAVNSIGETVMAVDAISQITTPTNAIGVSAPPSPQTLDYNSFLNLLIAQMKNQDPTKPMDPTQFVSQLASFSQVEQQVHSNAKLDALLSSMEIAQAGSLVGRTVTSQDGSISGLVSSVKIVSGGAVAVLDSGHQIPLGAGIIIS
jgi:flagellar basal-body rod modification protein FlgD